MADAIQLWSDMYEGTSPWCKERTYEDPTRIVSIGLPALIASEKARMATLEMKTEISAPMQEVAAAVNPVDSSATQPIPEAENSPVKEGTQAARSGRSPKRRISARMKRGSRGARPSRSRTRIRAITTCTASATRGLTYR